MQQYIDAVLAADVYTWSISVTLAVFGCFVLSMFFGSPWKSSLFFPGLVLGSLAANQGFQAAQIDLTADKALNTIAVSTVGLTAAMIVGLVILKIYYLIRGAMVKPVQRQHVVYRRTL